ncbi:DUF4190 domain-containing protein [Jatrophihabitans sp. YIM 134969]
MSAPQPPEDPTAPPGRPDPDPTRPDDAPSDATRTYEFHGEELDFDPYRFGAPEPVAPVWGPPAPAAGGPAGPTPGPGDRWSPGGGESAPEVRPGDYWPSGGAAPHGDAVFPPAGYTPPPTGSDTRVDLGKAPGGYPPPTHQGYPPPHQGGYPPPGGYPGRPGPSEADRWRGGNKLAGWGLGVGLVGCVLFFTTFFAILIGGTGLGLSIAAYVKARRGAPNKGLALAGIIVSIVAIVLGIALLIYAFSQYDLSCIVKLDGDTSRIDECVR